MTDLAVAPTELTPSDDVRTTRQKRGWRIFSIAFLLLFGAGALWSIATPLFAAPDETVHIVKAAAVVRGEFLGNLADGPESPQALVQVPEFYALIRWPGSESQHSEICFHARPQIPASCVEPSTFQVTPAAVVEGYTREAWIYNARYPPLYYAVVGLPSYIGGHNVELYLMRLVSAALSALFLALAVTVALVYSARRFLLLGLLIALTPMVFFLAGVINPAGFESAAGVCVWTCGAVLFLERLDDPPRPLLVALAFSAAVFSLIRSLSPFWLLCMVLCFGALSDWRKLLAFLRRRDAQVLSFCVLVVLGLALAWTANEHATLLYTGNNPHPGVAAGTSSLKILETSFSHDLKYIPGMVGVFGWFDTWSPRSTYVIWYALVLGIVALALWSATWRHKLILAALAAGIVILPVLISSSQARRYGYLWSGRDTLPLAVGLPILAAATLRVEAFARLRQRVPTVSIVAVILVFIAQFGAFYEALRRYSVGNRGALFAFLIHPSWQTPIGVIAPIVAEAVLLVLLLSATVWAIASPVAAQARAPRSSPADPSLG